MTDSTTTRVIRRVKTYKRETAGLMLAFLAGLVIWGIWNPQAWQEASFLTVPVFTFAGAAFALDAYFKRGSNG